MNQLIEKWKLLEGKHNARNTRERALIVGSVLLCIYLTWDFGFYQPQAKTREVLELRLSAAKSELVKLNAEEKVFSDSLANDPAAAKRRELLRLEEALKVRDEELQALAVGLIPAEKLPRVLYEMLDENDRLQFVGMHTAAARKLQFEGAAVNDENNEDLQQSEDSEPVENIGVFKHAVRVRFEGDFHAVYAYLKKIEKIQWKLYWQMLDYKVLKHPKAKIELEVFTLSTEEGLLSGNAKAL